MIADTNADMHRMYDEVGRQITTYDREVRALHKELESFAEIGERAVTGFNILNDGFGRIVNDIDGLSQRISSGLNTQSETVEMLTEKLRAELPKSLGELEKTLASLTEKFGRDYEAFLNKCNGLLPR
jgi:methyl-accepting chemotaxis protein